MIRPTLRSTLAAVGLLFASAPAMAETVDDIARDYVALSLEIGEREPGYIDAYYGPAEVAEKAKVAPRELPALAAAVAAIDTRLAAQSAPAGGMDARRIAFLSAQLRAAETRLRMLRGEKLTFEAEAVGLFGVRPELKPLTDYDPILARIEALLPGDGALADRVDAFQMEHRIPPQKLEPVMRAAIAECRARTARHIALSKAERFDLEFVTGKPWSGYNWYKGGAVSLIQINTDLPIFASRAVDLGCHEGYPGHHALNALLEAKLARGKGWQEFTVYPLFSPQSFIAEGTANYGIHLAFPAKERMAFEKRVVFPLAGLDPAGADRYFELTEAMEALSGARLTIARDYLDGAIDRETAIELTRKYQLVSRARASQSVDFTDTYRSYVINYGLGQEMARAFVERSAIDAKGRWRAMEALISEPTLPADLER